ncbi:MAG: hypothetical protein EOM14_16920, partial [Clostridia bacterium]|nr:hypothetical protein [Clostridia bacterium]
MDWKKQYEEKMTSLTGAAALIKSGDCIWSGGFGAAPPQLLDAIADRKDELHNVRIISSISCDPHRYLRGEFKGHIRAESFFLGPFEREFLPEGNIRVNSCTFYKTGYALQYVYKVDTMVCEVSEPDENGDMYYGPMGVAWNGRVASFAKKIIVQINREQGKVRGKNASVNVKDVDAICRFDHPLPELQQPPVSETDRAIASYIIPNIPDGCTLQVGLGGIANAGMNDAFITRITNGVVTTNILWGSASNDFARGIAYCPIYEAMYVVGNTEGAFGEWGGIG